jgi:hypothetical protein
VIESDIEQSIDDINDALTGIVDDLSGQISAEIRARENADDYIEDNYCPLSNGKIDSQYLPSSVDDVIESYPLTGQTELSAGWLSLTQGGAALTPETGKIYILLDSSTSYSTNDQFRWNGSSYVLLSAHVGIATANDLGIVKVGSGLSIDQYGELSLDIQYLDSLRY